VASMPPPLPPEPPSGPPAGAYPSGPPSFSPPYAAAPAPYASVARRRTGWLLFAQILAILEGIIFLLLGVGSILLAVAARSQLQQAINNLRGTASGVDVARLADVATGVFIGVGVFLIVYFAFFIWAAVISGRPSTGGRVVVVILDTILLLVSVLGFVGRSGNGGVGGSGGAYVIGYIVFWAWQALILIGMTFVATRPVSARAAPR